MGSLKYRQCDGSGEEDAECEYSLWTEDKNAHLWYLDEYEHCGSDKYGKHAFHESVSLGAPQPASSNDENESSDNRYGDILNSPSPAAYNSHWLFSIICIFIGFGAALAYYAFAKWYQRRNGYYSIKKIEREAKKERERIQKQD